MISKTISKDFIHENLHYEIIAKTSITNLLEIASIDYKIIVTNGDNVSIEIHDINAIPLKVSGRMKEYILDVVMEDIYPEDFDKSED